MYDKAHANTVVIASNGDSYLNGGNVGIGTTNPGAALHVEGATTVGFIVKATTASSYSRLMIQNDQGVNAYGQMITYGSISVASNFGLTLANYSVMSQVGSSGNGLIVGTENAKPLIFGTNSSEAMRILSGGNVGIGTTSPTISDGTGLHLAGKILRIETPKTPTSSGATGNIGEICWDTKAIYICTATNTWKRIAFESGLFTNLSPSETLTISESVSIAVT
jgi:hypothetical protein